MEITGSKFGRRELIKYGLGAAATLLVGCNSRAEPQAVAPQPVAAFDYFSRESLRQFESPFKSISKVVAGPSLLGNFNPIYMEELIKTLRSSNQSPDDRAAAIGSRLSWAITQGQFSALKIDDGGYYLTCAHGFLANSEAKEPTAADLYKATADVYDPNTGSLTPIVSFVTHPEFFQNGKNDIALFYAPSGKPMQASEGICLDSDFPPDGTELWMHSLFVDPRRNINHRFHYGRVDGNLQDAEYGYEGFIKVSGMVPNGGSSGAPIYDLAGNIRGVESGAINPTQENEYQNYAGSALTSVRGLDGLINEIKKGNIYKLLLN